MPTAAHEFDDTRVFTVTHPFHPRLGQRISLLALRQNWGEDRVYFQDEDGQLKSLLAAWTSFAALDPFVAVAAGRSVFRFADLLRLADLIGHLQEAEV